MRRTVAIGAIAAVALVAALMAKSRLQTPTVRAVAESDLRQYTGVYRWDGDAYLYLQIWHEFSGFDKPGQLVAFDESGEIRVLYPTDEDQFFVGPGAAVNTSIEARVGFQRDSAGKIVSLTWRRDGASARIAQRVDLEKHEDVQFSNGAIHLAGTLISPRTGGRHPAIILVHGSGAENREFILPFARFLIRRGVAVLGYDKRGVGRSTGDWNTASFGDLAGDVVAGFEFLKTRDDIDPTQVGMLGVSQAGWIMPIAAVRAKDFAFLISVSGAGVPAAETAIDHAQNEMTSTGMKPEMIAQIVGLMKLQYEFARTGQRWDEYAAARERIGARMGSPPPNFPGKQDDPYWQFIRPLARYDPGPTLRQLRAPTLAIFGELDNNIIAAKNQAAWEAALKAGGHADYTLRTIPKANHYLWEAKVGNNAEIPSLRRFVPEYFTTIREWLAKRLKGMPDAAISSRWIWRASLESNPDTPAAQATD